VKVTRRVAFSVALIPFFAVMMFAPGIASIFTTDPELIEIGSRALRIALLIIPLVALQIVGSIFFQAIGKAIPALFLSLSRQIIFLIPAVLILPNIWGRAGVWIAFPVADLLAVVVTVVWLHHELVRLDSVHRDDGPDSTEGKSDERRLSPAPGSS
jgi:Na+-driven multidrug efflux pump